MSEKALLVTLILANEPDGWSIQDITQELEQLARSCGVVPVADTHFVLKTAQVKFLIGPGQADKIRDLAVEHKADLVILSRNLSPSQQRNLEEVTGLKTIDRTQLILDVFARRARSKEGQLQVELAQLNYLLPRLVGQGIVLSRQGGGIGTRGPGEQKLETHRRKIRDRIAMLEREVEALSQRRELYRKKRRKHQLPVVSLVGYTNAGKSTLFNRMTESNVVAKNQMFSTLDPTVRECILSTGRKILLVDTVGFLHLLPHHLIDAFKATLEEIEISDLILHVIDVSHPRATLLEKSVREVLASLNVEGRQNLMVLNKADLLDPAAERALAMKEWSDGIFVSAVTGKGIDKLSETIESLLEAGLKTYTFDVPYGASTILNQIYELGEVLERHDEGDQVRVLARMMPSEGEALVHALKTALLKKSSA